MLTTQEAEAVLAVAVMSSLAGGRSNQEERQQIASLFETLAQQHDLPALASLQQRVILNQYTADQAVVALGETARKSAFEIAVCVVNADGRVSDREQAFLDDLERRFELDHGDALAFERQADAVAHASSMDGSDDPTLLVAGVAGGSKTPGEAGTRVNAGFDATQQHAESRRHADDAIPDLGPSERGTDLTPGAGDATLTSGGSALAANTTDTVSQEVDGVILRYAILNGALELLPQNLATMAILPLQTRMVFTIGKRYGHSLSAAHIKEFIAVLGVGATSQMLENFARKALGSFVKKALGKTAGVVTKTGTGPMMTFATTYAMGKVAKSYYAGGRQLSAVDLRSIFQRDLNEGKTLYDQHRGRIEQSAGSLDTSKVLSMVRGSPV